MGSGQKSSQEGDNRSQHSAAYQGLSWPNLDRRHGRDSSGHCTGDWEGLQGTGDVWLACGSAAQQHCPFLLCSREKGGRRGGTAADRVEHTVSCRSSYDTKSVSLIDRSAFSSVSSQGPYLSECVHGAPSLPPSHPPSPRAVLYSCLVLSCRLSGTHPVLSASKTKGLRAVSYDLVSQQ